jgi:Uma2 family endonuclease
MSMNAAPETFRMSVKAYLALDNASPQTRYEYLNGRVMMMSGETRRHALMSANVIITLGQSLRGSSCRVFTSDARVMLSDARYVYPDVSVSCAAQSDTDLQTVTEPTVIVEVLSPSTEVYDRGLKLRRYRECPSLQAVLLISQEQPVVEVYRRQSADIWTIQTYYMDDIIGIETIGATLPVAEIYRDITFPPEPEELEETPESQP